MRIVIMGTGPFAVPSCQSLVDQGYDLPLVVTRPLVDPHSKKPPPRPVFEWASQRGLEIFEPPSINAPEAIARLRAAQPDLLFVCDYGQILSSECLAAARLGGINLHGSLLPRHRGAAPVQWALLRGDHLTGVSVIHMTPRLDAGPVLAVAQTDIRPDETAAELEPRLAELGVAATTQAVQLLAGWDGVQSLGQPQDRTLATSAPRLSKADGQLDFRRSAAELEQQVRGCQPWPGTYAELHWPGGKQMRLLIRASRGLAGRIRPLADAAPGQVTHVAASQLAELQDVARVWSGDWEQLLAVATGPHDAPGETLVISRLQPAGKREMSVVEFLRGHPLAPGTHFELPATATQTGAHG